MPGLTRRAVVQAAGIAGPALLAGCSGGSHRNARTGSTPAAGAPSPGPFATAAAGAAREALGRPGGSLTVMAERLPASLDFVTHSAPETSAMLGLIYNGLLTLRGGTALYPDPTDTTLMPDLALAQPEQPDDFTYIFRLRAGVRWHDLPPMNGRLLVAEDVRAAYLRAAQAPGSLLKSEFGMIAGVEAPDQSTVRIVLKEPYAPFTPLVAGGVNRYIGAPNAGSPTPRSVTAPAGTGPFIYSRPLPEGPVRFQRHPTYFKTDGTKQPLPYLAGVSWMSAADPAARLQAYRAQQAGVSTVLSAAEADQLRGTNPNDFAFTQAPGVSGYLFMRVDLPPFNDVRVRQALSLAIDRPALLQAIAGGQGAGDLPVPRLLTAFAAGDAALGDNARLLSRDLGAAKQLLSAAGLEAGLSTTLTYSPQYGEALVKTVQILQANLREAGVQATPAPLDYATFLQTAFRGRFQGLAYMQRDLYPDPDPYLSYYYLTDGIFYQDGSNDAALQALVLKQRRTLDPAARAATVQAIQRLLVQQQYRVYDVAASRFFARGRSLQNFRGSDWLPLSRLETAWLQT